MDIILASKSPRRSELLKNLGITDFRIIPSKREISPGASAEPGEAVCAIARGKAEDVAAFAGGDGSLIIAADTLVYLDGAPLGKPRGEREAAGMLRRLSGREHDVYTGVCVVYGDLTVCESEKTRVKFRDLSDGEIAAYIATGEPMDKAGAYGAQGRGAVFIERIEGDFFNVMGLPLCRLYMMLKSIGITV